MEELVSQIIMNPAPILITNHLEFENYLAAYWEARWRQDQVLDQTLVTKPLFRFRHLPEAISILMVMTDLRKATLATCSFFANL